MTIEHKMGIPPFIVKLWQEKAFGIKKIYTSEAKVEVLFL